MDVFITCVNHSDNIYHQTINLSLSIIHNISSVYFKDDLILTILLQH